MKKALVLGASGATGRLLVKQLLHKGVAVIAIVRDANSLDSIDASQPALEIIEAEISQMSPADLSGPIAECDVVLSCLGHNLTFKGMYGPPRELVTDAIRTVTTTIESIIRTQPVKIILMNTTGNRNGDIPEKPPFSQRLVIAVLRLLLPPHVDNEKAADFLRLEVGQDNRMIEWSVVRPDGLVDAEQVTPYDVLRSPTRNAIFDAGSTSRINVADFMSELVVNSELWCRWKGQMPVVYNQQ